MGAAFRDQPEFAVLDVVVSRLPDDNGGEGVVASVRRYTDGRYTFEVAPVDETGEVPGGFYSADQLVATHRRASVTRFWTHPDRARRIAVVKDDHPRSALRGLYGVIVAEVTPGDTYTVEFLTLKGWKQKTRRRDIAAHLLRLTDDRLPSEPVPRPVRTLHPGRDEFNMRPAHDFDVLDEIDQYL